MSAAKATLQDRLDSILAESKALPVPESTADDVEVQLNLMQDYIDVMLELDPSLELELCPYAEEFMNCGVFSVEQLIEYMDPAP